MGIYKKADRSSYPPNWLGTFPPMPLSPFPRRPIAPYLDRWLCYPLHIPYDLSGHPPIAIWTINKYGVGSGYV